MRAGNVQNLAFDYLQLLGNKPKGHVSPVHPGCWLKGDVKLRSIAVRPFVGHP